MIRFFGIYLFLSAITVLTAMPTSLFGMFGSQSDYLVRQREILLAMELLRLGFYVIAGTLLLVFSRPLAKGIVKGLETPGAE